MKQQKRFTRKNGITLISLVITIVIMLILATVTIKAINGNFGLISKTEESSDVYTKIVLKDYFTTIRSENKKIATRLNDVLDMHINKLNTSAENGEKSDSRVYKRIIITLTKLLA